MKTKLVLILLLISSPIFADICGDISIGKDNDTYRGEMKIGYDFSWEDFAFIPYIDYVNYFTYTLTGDIVGGHPFLDVFGCGLLFKYKDIYLNVYHECSHAVSSINSMGKPVLYNDAEPNKSSTWIVVGYRFGKEF